MQREVPDEHPTGPPPAEIPRGRGSGLRLAHRYEGLARQAEDDGWAPSADVADADERRPSGPPPPETVVTVSAPRSALSRNDSPDIGFDQAVNPYRGCEHGCVYCYARPTHAYLDLSPGLDFETRILAREGLAAVLRRELAAPGYRPSPINIGSATDAYQPAERSWRLTREVLELLLACRHPFTLVTKSAGVLRDLDLLAEAAALDLVQIFVSVTTLDPALARTLEPRAAAPARRLEALRRLAAAGVPVGLNVAPIIPFLNEPEIEAIVEAGARAGARSVHYTVLRLPWEVAPLFRLWLDQHQPERAARILARVRELHGLEAGDERVYRADYRSRMKGHGPWADLIRQRVQRAARHHGLSTSACPLSSAAFRAPARPPARAASEGPEADDPQGRLFG